MNQEGGKGLSKKGSQKAAGRKRDGKSSPGSTTPEVQAMLLDPPQIAEEIRRYFHAKPHQGDLLWSLIEGDGTLLRVWNLYAGAGLKKEFWQGTWQKADTKLELSISELRAIWHMHTFDPHHLMQFCHNSFILSLACDLFATRDHLQASEHESSKDFGDALVMYAGEQIRKLMGMGRALTTFWPVADRGNPTLAALIAGAADPEQPESSPYLAHVLDQMLPEEFHSTAYDWLRLPAESDLLGFFRGLSYSQTDLSPLVELFDKRLPDHRQRPLILQVDMEPAMCQLMGLIISRGFEDRVLVVSVDNITPALLLASVLVPDLILTDLMYVGLNGVDFVKYLKMNPVTQSVPFVFITAKSRNMEKDSGFLFGAKDYITKPFSPKELLDSLERLLGLEAKRP